MFFKFFLSFLISYVFSAEANIVLIKNGLVIGGKRTTVGQNKTYYYYQGIPYAKPPIGDLRFAAPVPPDDWTLPKLALADKSRCLIFGLLGSEDCLYINVYTPTKNPFAKLPVMVFIYGGFYSFGDSRYISVGPDYLLEQDVVFVDLNYRLGVFGFLSTQDEAASGNWALKDQILGLKWVQENIHIFGGDKNAVTLFGQSAGAGAISYLIQAPQAKGLFQKVILQSGSPLNLWNLWRNPRKSAFKIGDIFKIKTNDSQTLIDGLRNVPAWQLGSVSFIDDVVETIETNPRNGLIFAPVVEPDIDGAVVTEKSYENLYNGNFQQVPVMIGFTSQEAGKALDVVTWLKIYLLSLDIYPNKLIPIDMNLNQSDTSVIHKVGLDIKLYYFGLIPALVSDEIFIQFIGDDQFVRPIHETARLLSQYTSVYFYRFAYQGDYINPPRTTTDVFHGEDLYYIFTSHDAPELSSDNDITMRNKMIKLWTNFAKFSNPTPDPDETLDSVTWNNVNPNNIYYLDIGKKLKMSNDFGNYSIDFWKVLFDKYGNRPFDTY